MRLPLFIAFRYLFAKKSHNVINIISIISAIGIGIGSMALIVILSVYNGFDNLIKDLYKSYEADFVVTPARGKTFEADTLFFQKLGGIKGIRAVCPIVEENVFIKYGDNQSIATIKGIDAAYEKVSSISKNIVEGEFQSMEGEIPTAVVGQKLAQDLMLRVRFLTPIELYFPDREREISLINPMESLRKEVLFPGGIIRLEQNFDKNHIFAPLETVRNLIGYYKEEATSAEIYLDSLSAGTAGRYQTFYKTTGESIAGALGDGYIVKDRFRQNETIYKMMKAEKFTVYLIMFFVIIIISINIFSSLTILILDKKEDIATFASMGAGTQFINRIFVLQGWLISALGSVIGIITGLILCLVQLHTGVIQIPGSFIVNAYPVSIQIPDIFITLAGVNLIGYLIARLANWNNKPYREQQSE